MCQKRNTVYEVILHKKEAIKVRLDSCIRTFIKELANSDFNTVASCCGHNRYPLTVICEHPNRTFYDLISGKTIPRKRNFYKKDKDGFYYIPEVGKGRTFTG